MTKINLFELLGRPVETVSSGGGTPVTGSADACGDRGVQPSIEDSGTGVTRMAETRDEHDVMLALIEDSGTRVTRSNLETYDDDSVLPSM